MGTPEDGAQEFGGTHGPLVERPGDAQQIVPVADNQWDGHAGSGNGIQTPIIGRRIHPPKAGFADIGQPGAELVAEEPKQAEDDITDPGGIRHDFDRLELGLVFEEAIQDGHRIAERAWDDDRMEAGELVRGEVVIGHAAMRVEIVAMGPGIDRADRDDEPQPIRGRDFASAPGLGQGNGRLGIHEARIGACQRLGPEIVVLHPTEAAPRQRRDVGPHDRFEANVTGFGQQDRTEADG
jgi:hypothetical protein